MRLLWILFALAACSKTADKPRVFVLNGLDIPVTVTISGDGDPETFEVPARGRATPDVRGKRTVKVTTTSGALISESEVSFGALENRNCYRVYNVVGAAAYVHEDVAYGTGFGKPGYRRRAGEISDEECGVSFAFEDPPAEIAVDRHGPGGTNLGWLHYEHDGGWVAAVTALLDDTGQWASQSRAKAQRIVRAVITHDPNNAALPAIKDRLDKLRLAVPQPTAGNLLAQPDRRRATK